MPSPPRNPPPATTGSHSRHDSAERRQGSTRTFPSSLRVPGVVVVQRFSTALTNQAATQFRTDRSPSRESPGAVIMPKRRHPLDPVGTSPSRPSPLPTTSADARFQRYSPRIASAAPSNRTPQPSTPSTPTHREYDWDHAATPNPKRHPGIRRPPGITSAHSLATLQRLGQVGDFLTWTTMLPPSRAWSKPLSYATVSTPASSSVQILIRNVSGFPSLDQM